MNTQLAESRTKWTTLLAAAATLFLVPPSAANAQCGGWVHDLGSYGPEFLRFIRPRVIDRDGPDGAQIPRIIGTSAGRLIMKTDEDWAYLSGRLSGYAYPLEAWDADGPGPMTPRLYFGISTTPPGAAPYLDSVPWPQTGSIGSHPLTPLPGQVYHMRLTDPDGQGPQRARPIVVCAGSSSATTLVVFEWNGSDWERRGSMLLGTWARLFVTPSTSGAGDEWVIYGNFSRLGFPLANGIARFDGNDWVAMGDGLQGGTVTGVTSWDHDADASTPPRLVACGSFNKSGAANLNRVAMFDGARWVSLGDNVGAQAHSIAAYTHVTTGREELLAAASGPLGYNDNSRFRAFDGSQWRDAGDKRDFIASAAALQRWDPDGPLSDPPAALALITNEYDTPRVEPGLFIWNGEQWRVVAQAPWVSESVQATWNRDGDGTSRPVIAHVRINEYQTDEHRDLILWDGITWETHSLGLKARYINALAQWDPDGSGPQAPLLVIGGAFNTPIPGAPDAVNIVAWDGQQLVSLGEGLRSYGAWSGVRGITTWDPDDDGPLPAELIAYGAILGSGADSFGSVARFDGNQWMPLGDGVFPLSSSGSLDIVSKALAWDPDGAGPMPSELLLLGNFALTPGGSKVPLAKWNGSVLQPFLPTSPAMIGGGPLIALSAGIANSTHPRLLAGYTYTQNCWDDPGGGSGYNGCRTNYNLLGLYGESWWSYRSYTSIYEIYGSSSWSWSDGPPSVFAEFDPDGPGPIPPRLVVGFNGANTPAFNVASYGFPHATDFVGGMVNYWDNGTGWPEDYTIMRSLISHPLLPDLQIASYSGEFYELVTTNTYNDPANPPRPIEGIARWMEGPPRILDIPEPRTNHETRAFALTVRAIGGGDLGYQWTFNGTPLKVGPTERGSIVHSPGGPTLIISNASHLDQGQYVCRISNTCGSTFSPTLSMPAIGCKADVNHDGLLDILDFLDFMHAFGECDGLPGPCGATPNADFNGDTLVDILDLLDFVDAFGTGCDE
ncbi:MAG: hypothetical protein KF838_13840 [Phycisphaeraceae bacterium]|nr:MAG: hypothetical protein KF838_13840 [Phycisphaeraceae bacterium]